jgi:hypothetical protein
MDRTTVAKTPIIFLRAFPRGTISAKPAMNKGKIIRKISAFTGMSSYWVALLRQS